MALVKIHFHLDQDSDGYPPIAVESLWAEVSDRPDEYVIDSVPFFVREATLGDTVLAREDDQARWFDHVVSRSKNSLVRVVFFDNTCVEAIGKRLTEMGCATEHLLDHNLMAVSVPEDVLLTGVQAYLQLEADVGRIDYEEPILRQ
jgi:hypothetical protein